jgi:hypothetical protein
MYILINKKTNRIEQQNSEQLSAYDKNLYYECYIESFPPKASTQYYAASNIREEVKVLQEAYSQEEIYYNEETGLDEVKVVDYPAITKTYNTCDILVKDRPQVSEEFKAQMLAKNNAIKEIAELKQKLKDTDYQAIKYAEGWITEEDYAPIKAERQEWRNEINRLQSLTEN